MTGSLPRRYARALMILAQEEGEGLAGRFAEELENFLAAVQKIPNALSALADDSLEISGRLAATEEIAKRLGIHLLVKNFLMLLVKKDRMGRLPGILAAYQRLRDEADGVLRGILVAPQPAEQSFVERIESILGERLRKKVILRGEGKGEIIGGLVLKMDHVVYDGSVKKDLQRMKERMLQG